MKKSYLGLNKYILLILVDLFLKASKAALLRFFETLRIELNPDIKITIVFPGVVATDMTTPRYIENVSNNMYFLYYININTNSNNMYFSCDRFEK